MSRNELSYFQSYKVYFIAIYLAFFAWPVGDILGIAASQTELLRLATQGVSTSGAIIALIWGYVATRLYLYPETLSIKRMFSAPIRPIYLVFASYCVPMVLAFVFAWADPASITTGPSIQVTYIPEGITKPAAVTSSFLLAIGAVIVVVFTAYPLIVLSRRRALVKDREVRKALLIIAASFGIISLTLVSAIAIASFGYSILGFANFVSVLLIIVAVQAFQKPTFLKSFLGVIPSLESSPSAAHYDQMILIHSPANDRFGPVAKFVSEGVTQRELIVYFYNGDVSSVSDGLSKQGVDVTRMMVKGSVRVSPLGSIYPRKGVLDDTALEAVQGLLAEAKALGNDGLRVILDYDDSVMRPIAKFVQHLTDSRWTSPDHQLHVLMVFDSTAFRGEEASLAQLESQVRTLDLAETKNSFSNAVGAEHTDIAGKKLLLEYDPQGNYDEIFRSLLAENASNMERTVVFTRTESPLYRFARRQPGAKIFVTTSRVSYPKMEGENLFLLPTYDSSLLLDALNKTIEAYAGSRFTIIFDNISHFIFTIGPERTYSLIRQSLELMISSTITAVFSINSLAHDSKTMSSFENMFDMELVWEKGARNPIVKRKQTILG